MQEIGLFKAIGAKMDFLSQRQSVLARNVANADTNGYKPLDLKEPDFSTYLKKETAGSAGTSVTPVAIASTDDQHIGATGNTVTLGQKKQKDVYETAPAGNAVILEEQLMKAGKNVMDYNLMVNLYQKQVGMLRTALDAGR
ncbi:MAG: flagellar basal body rod protein FlgB [Alphaproteobacteria bacterium]|nr:flagellar basal body rod protein FlgB [Alphaproteobacteria bacterium]